MGQNVAVFDPLGTPTLGGDWGDPAKVKYFHDKEKFLDFIEDDRTRHFHLFIDEAHNILGHSEECRDNYWLLTEGRHYFLNLHLLTQRPKKLHPDVRSQCGRCYMFRLAIQDSKEIGADFGYSDIHAEILDTGDFLILNSGSSTFERANVFKLLKGKAS